MNSRGAEWGEPYTEIMIKTYLSNLFCIRKWYVWDTNIMLKSFAHPFCAWRDFVSEPV